MGAKLNNLTFLTLPNIPLDHNTLMRLWMCDTPCLISDITLLTCTGTGWHRRWPGSLPGCVPAEPSSPGPRTASTAQWSPQTAPRPWWHRRETVAWSSSQIPAGQRRKPASTGSVCPDSWSTGWHHPRSREPSPAGSLKLWETRKKKPRATDLLMHIQW